MHIMVKQRASPENIIMGCPNVMQMKTKVGASLGYSLLNEHTLLNNVKCELYSFGRFGLLTTNPK